MRKYIYIVLLLLFCSARSSAQFTLVSGTITDVNGLPYACGTISASIVNLNGQSLYLNGVQFSPQPGSTKLGCPVDPSTSRTSGAFSLQLADNSQIKCGSGASIVTCATQTQWLFTVNSSGALPPLGTGPQTCSVTTTITGSAASIGSLFSCPAQAVIAGAGLTITTQNTIILSKNCGTQVNCFFVNANVAYCFGTAATITNGSNTVQCTTGNFTPADIGKAIFATSGCCGVQGNFQGVLILPEGTITSINSPTSVQVSTTGNASAGGSVGTNVLIWGNYDDANINKAEAAGAALVASACPAYFLSFGSMLVKEPHFNNQSFPTACGGVNLPAGPSLGAATDYQEAILGYGPSTSLLVFSPTYDFPACTFTSGIVLNACNFASAQIILENFGIYGGGNGNTGSHNVSLACAGPGSQFFNIGFSGFAGADTQAVGFCFDVSRGSLVTVDGFGHNPVSTVSFSGNVSIQSMCFFCFAGDSAGPSLVVASNSTFMAYGDSWGLVNGNFPIWDISGNFTTYSGAFYAHTGTAGNPPAARVENGGVLTAYNGNLSADFSGCGPTACDAIDVLSGGQLFLNQTKVRGRGAPSFAVNVAAGGSFTDLCGNTLTSSGGGLLTGSVFGNCSITGTVQTSGNWSVPAGAGAGQWGTGPSVACPGTLGASAGDSISQFCTITVGTGTVGANPVVTITFPTPFWTAPGSCDGKMTGGTAALANFTSGVPSATSIALTYQGTPAASSTIGLKVSCR